MTNAFGEVAFGVDLSLDALEAAGVKAKAELSETLVEQLSRL